MEAHPVRLHIKTFCKILVDFESNFCKKLKTESFISDVDSENGNPLFSQDLNVDIINLLKHQKTKREQSKPQNARVLGYAAGTQALLPESHSFSGASLRPVLLRGS